ncbi:BRCA2 repeat [Macleaya cordata]|uniref:BRCA2 repeat n=1 Tax=Macleaya cordata TaxID=56857 RepID=A0A200QBG2_MACCD|nr:BRCA2 repeat [Macleaya cordata]
MQTTQRLPTWQIFTDDGNNYRWVTPGNEPATRSEKPPRVVIHPKNPTSRLPSMTDLLFQGSSKLLQNNGSSNESPPMFRTGLGKSVAVQKSSILKALSVLGEDDGLDGGSSKLLQNNGSSNESPPMFQTGLGKSVVVKKSSILKALSVLGEDDVLDRGSSKLLQNNGNSNESPPMFRTGFGKSVAVKKSSILKALSVLGGDDVLEGGQVQGADNECSVSNSLFQTGSGKIVNISSAGLIRAQTLLGLDGNSTQFTSDESDAWGNSPHLEARVEGHNNGFVNSRSVPICHVDYPSDIYTSGHVSKKEALQNVPPSEMHSSSSKPPAIKFQTAGGRSLSVSNDALQRARSLLGDSEFGVLPNEGGIDSPGFSSIKENTFNKTSLDKENDPYASCLHRDPTNSKCTSNCFPPPKGPFSKNKQFSASLEASNPGDNLFKQVDENGLSYKGFCRTSGNIPCVQKPSRSEPFTPNMVVGNSLAKNIGSRVNPVGRPPSGPLVDISNNTSAGTAYANQKQSTCEKRRLGSRSSISPFKRPRCSRFVPLLYIHLYCSYFSLSLVISQDSSCKTKVSSRYPFHAERMTVKEYFGEPPRYCNLLEDIQDKVKCMNADHAEMYMFRDASGLDGIGAEAFHHMLIQSGASMLNTSREWVANHYKWIVWKLACYERGYPEKGTWKYLTVPNVLEELKYRYEREVNHGHRSALKRILEGDASAASMVVLCISAIRFNPNQELEREHGMAPCEDANKPSNVAKIELTDGWYSIDAILDAALTNLLVAGKLFVGQKLRIWRAALCGWVAPITPLEASKTVSLLLHINGTYRAHWAARLGFCKELGPPLAFSCIKGDGGLVPRTLVGVTRIYPVLYKERLTDGGSIVRSERMENKIRQLYNERQVCSAFMMRSTIAEGIASELQRDVSSSQSKNDSDSEEGAKIFKILERAAEPEVLMADMSTKQLTSFATYQAKQEAIRQSDMQKKIEKALEDAGLSERQVTPFMRVRVIGLTSKHSERKSCPREGLITIWNPTEKQQQLELVEGQAYIVAGLIPLKSDSDTIYLQARGSTTKWQPLPPLAVASFEPFFSPRKSILLSNMGEVPLASEFDIAAVVVYVGEAYRSGHQKKQWVFVTDDSMSGSELLSEGSSNCLLAISFCSPSMDYDSFPPINYTLAGSTVGFCNLVKRARDQVNNLWVAEATDNSTYSFCYDLPACSHLKEAAASAYRWAKISSLVSFQVGGENGGL